MTLSVRNDGPLSGDHSVLLFSKPPSSGVDGVPLKQLVSFERVHLEAGTEQEVVFNVNPCEDLGTVGVDGIRTIALGVHTLMVGAVHHPLIIVGIITVISCALLCEGFTFSTSCRCTFIPVQQGFRAKRGLMLKTNRLKSHFLMMIVKHGGWQEEWTPRSWMAGES